MPTTEFTLEDIQRILGEALISEREHTKGLFEAEREHTQGLLDGALINERQHTESLFAAEREHTRGMIQESAEDVKASITDEFLSFWDTNLGPAFDELHSEFAQLRRDVKGMRLIVDRHSKDIMELRAK